MKDKVLVVYGGKSVEHDISIITALQVLKNLPEEFDFLPTYVDRDGIWWTADNLGDIEIYHNFQKRAKNARRVTFLLGENEILIENHKKFVPFANVKAVLNCCHGNSGEDGAFQGVFKACDMPQTSCGVLSSALCMDKAAMKDVLKANNIPSPDFFVLKKDNFDFEKTLKKCKFPLVVKPANLGSSIGISVCKNADEFSDAIELAFEFDQKVVVERLVENLREFNCACFAFQKNLIVSDVCEVTNKGEIFSFEDKYLSEKAERGHVESALSKKVQALTEKIYSILDCTGVVRVDFLFDEKTKTLFVNEVNTIPGSMAFYLFKDISFKELLSSILKSCLQNFDEEKSLIKSFNSDALQIFENAKQKTIKK